MPFKDPNYTQIPNELLGDQGMQGWMANLTRNGLLVVLAVCRLTFGYHRGSVSISIREIGLMTGLSPRDVLLGAADGKRMGLLERRVEDGQSVWIALVENGAVERTQAVTEKRRKRSSPTESLTDELEIVDVSAA